jgi:hypothetical protein
MSREQASEYLLEVHSISRSPRTLSVAAVRGNGPVFRKDGRFCRYDQADLDEYAERALGQPRRSTSERNR